MMIVLLSSLSMSLVLLTWEIYRDFVLENHEDSLKELLSREIQRSLQELEESAEEIGMYTQNQSRFRKAFREKKKQILTEQIDNQFQQYHVTVGSLKLVQIYAFDKAFDIQAWSTEGPPPKNKLEAVCNDAVSIAANRRGPEQLQVLSDLCEWQGRVYYSVIVPIGGLRHEGYLQVVVDPAYAFMEIEGVLGMPINIELSGGYDLYHSRDWLFGTGEDDFVIASYHLYDVDGKALIMLSAQRNLKNFVAVAKKERNRLVMLAGVMTLIMVVIALWLLEKSTVIPIRQLIEQLNRVRQDRRNLNKPIEVAGNAEIIELVKVFNTMSADLANLYDEFEVMAFTDKLTMLPNRALFLDRLTQTLLLSKRKGERLGVMLLDLDGFKEINDTLGHQVGDKLLQEIAERLKRTMRASSTVARVKQDGVTPLSTLPIIAGDEGTIARLGGDEFAILLPNLKGVEGAVSVAKRVTVALEPTADIDGSAIVIAGTMGIAMYPSHGEEAEELLRRADIALHVAKHLHSDFSVYDSAYDNHSVNQLALKAELRTAIEENQLVLYYQPKLNFETGCVSGVEALVRWQHPERGLIPPDQFIPLSEQRGLIGLLTEWVINEALRQYKEWQGKGIFLKVAVNLSTRVLYDLSLPNKIEQALEDADLSPTALALEITEEATMLDPKRALEVLNRLDEMGLSLSIDDFGTGYSSLGYLKRLPVDEIKIDRTFVMEMEESENDAKIVHATIDLAHKLGLTVVAEGVETEVALNMLKSLKCDYAQGFYLSRPIPPDELVEWLLSSGWACAKP